MSTLGTKIGIPALAIATAMFLLAAAVAVPADAARPKLTRGDGNVAGTSTNCTILGNHDLECTGELSGLGGTPTAHLVATVSANFDCFNPAGQGPNAGHSGPTTVSGPTEPLNVQNGKATFDLTIQAPSGPDAPNAGWSCTLTSITYSNVVLVVDTVSGQFSFSLGSYSA